MLVEISHDRQGGFPLFRFSLPLFESRLRSESSKRDKIFERHLASACADNTAGHSLFKFSAAPNSIAHPLPTDPGATQCPMAEVRETFPLLHINISVAYVIDQTKGRFLFIDANRLDGQFSCHPYVGKSTEVVMSRIQLILGLSLLILLPSAGPATIRRVPSDFSSVQAAINSSANGDTVLVDHGTYTENIDFLGKSIVVASLLAVTGDTSHVALTVLDGGGSAVNKSVVTFQNAESNLSVLRGFRIRNGYASGAHGGGVTVMTGSTPRIEDCQIVDNTGDSGPVNGIGIFCKSSSPTVTRCLIGYNTAASNGNYDHAGGGVCVLLGGSPLFTNCSIVGNAIAASAYYRNYGAGVYCNESMPVFRTCTIADNTGDYGAGVYAVSQANVELHNCIISGNHARGNGGAAAGSQVGAALLDSCALMKNHADGNGGALYVESRGGLIATFCTITDNSASSGGAAFGSADTFLTVTNCVIWYNWPGEIAPANLPYFSYCDVRGGYRGPGNLDIDPLFCDWVTGQYTLASNSPCLTGSSGGTRIGGYAAGCGAILPRTRKVAAEYASIQDAIFHSYQGDTILVGVGTYAENFQLWGRRVLVTSQYTLSGDTSHIRTTVLNGGGQGVNKSVVSFLSTEDSMTVLRGFTITNGYASGGHGGGISLANNARPIIDHCWITGNTGTSGPAYGIGINCIGSSPIVSSCIISNNAAPANGNYDHEGGGVYIGVSSSPLFTDCAISRNMIAASVYYRNYGGGVYSTGSSPVFLRCMFSGNVADYGGAIGAWNASDVRAQNCIFRSDTVRAHGGAVGSFVSSVVQLDSCSLTKNYAGGNGGALYMEQSGRVNATRSTVTDNNASMGAGVFASSGTMPTLTNCIIWYNWFSEIFPLALTQVSYCDVRGGYMGTGNVDVDPLFCDWLTGQYTLASNSRCLTSGNGGSRMGYYPAACAAIAPRTRKVPQQYTSIQDAILHSYQGDTILVSTGTTTENFSFWGRRVLLTSQFALSGDTSYIGQTVLNGGGQATSNSAVSFIQAEDSMCVLRGFTITNGYASGNHAGGVTIANGSWPIIEDSRIVWNTGSSGPVNGIGMSCAGSSPTIRRCAIRDNSAPSNGNYDHKGGGVYVTGSSAPLFDACTISRNAIAASVYYRNYGGGVFCDGSFPVFHHCSISENSADQGGGMYLSGNSTAQIFNSLFVLDLARTTGGGLYTANSNPTCVNNTFSRNVAASGGAIYATNSATTILNTICWRDTANGAQELSVNGGSTAVTYSDVQGGWTGTGNISLNPLFKDEVGFRISSNSPCIDAGSPDPAYNDPSDPAHPDSALFPAMGALRSDIGAYGGSGSSATIPTAVKEHPRHEVPQEFRLEQNYPNPFNPTTLIRYTIASSKENGAGSGDVSLVAYDVLGREIATLINEKKVPGSYEVKFDGSGLASGVYFYRLTAGSFVQTRKMMVVK